MKPILTLDRGSPIIRYCLAWGLCASDSDMSSTYSKLDYFKACGSVTASRNQANTSQTTVGIDQSNPFKPLNEKLLGKEYQLFSSSIFILSLKCSILALHLTIRKLDLIYNAKHNIMYKYRIKEKLPTNCSAKY